MRKIVFFWCFLVCSVSLHAQVLTVRDKITRQPIELVSVYSNNPRVFDVTDAQGRADLKGFETADSIFIEIIGFSPLIYSYQQLEEKQFVLYLEESPIVMKQLVVSANRWQQQAREVPNKIIAISTSQLQIQNPQTAADLLGTSGEVFIQKSQLGGGSPMIRGFAANRVLITVDGVRMNTAIFRSGNLQNVISLDPFAAEKTEVTFGPGSMMYGSDAIGGVMSFYTLEPKLATRDGTLFKSSAVARTSSATREKTGHFDINIGTKKLASLTSVTYIDFDHMHMGGDGPEEYLRPEYVARMHGKDSVVFNPDPREQLFTGYDQINLMQKFRFTPHDNWDLRLGLHYSESSDVPRYDRLIEYGNGQLRNAEWYYGPQKWFMGALNVLHTRKRGPYTNARLTAALQLFEESRHDRRFGSSTLRHRVESVDVFTINLDFDKLLRRHHRIFYGAELLLSGVGSRASAENIVTGSEIPTSTRYPDGATWNSYAAYLNYVYNIRSELTLQTGLRYNFIHMDAKFTKDFFPFPFSATELTTSALTGSAGLVYQPGGNWELNLNFATGFRAPNVDDAAKVFDSEPGSVIVPNPDLKPEYAYNVECGIAKILGDIAKIDATAYYTWLKDAMVRREYTLSGADSIVYDGALSRVLAIQNAADAYVWGIQAGIEVMLPKGFGLISRVNYQKGREELDSGDRAPLRHAAPWFGVSHLIYKRERLKIDLYAMYNGEFAFDDMAPSEQNKPHIYAADEGGDPYAPGWCTINLKAMYQVTNFLMLSAGLENIGDRRYRPYSSGIAAPGRNFIGSLKVTF